MTMTGSAHTSASSAEGRTETTAVQRARYSVGAITSDDEIAVLEADWDRASAASGAPNVFATFDWYRAWYRHQAKREGTERLQPYVLTLKRAGEIRGIAPLTRATTTQFGMGLQRLQFSARDHEWDYNDLVIGDDAEGMTEAVAKHLSCTKHEWDLVDLMDMRDTDSAVLRIQRAMTRAGLSCALLPVEERCPYLPIDGPWEQTIARRSRTTQKAFRNRESRLRKMAGDAVRIRVLEAPHTEPGLLERMIKLEEQKRSGGVLSVPFVGRHPDVFESVLKTLGPKGWLCVVLLEWEDRLLSWDLLFRCGNKLWDYLTVYDHEFARISPGNMLLPAAMDYGFAHGFTEYDYLSGEEPYKMQWTTGYHQRARIVIWNERWKSRLYAAAYCRMRVRTALPDHSESHTEEDATPSGGDRTKENESA